MKKMFFVLISLLPIPGLADQVQALTSKLKVKGANSDAVLNTLVVVHQFTAYSNGTKVTLSLDPSTNTTEIDFGVSPEIGRLDELKKKLEETLGNTVTVEKVIPSEVQLGTQDDHTRQ
jgi:hypothetical protein